MHGLLVVLQVPAPLWTPLSVAIRPEHATRTKRSVSETMRNGQRSLRSHKTLTDHNGGLEDPDGRPATFATTNGNISIKLRIH